MNDPLASALAEVSGERDLLLDIVRTLCFEKYGREMSLLEIRVELNPQWEEMESLRPVVIVAAHLEEDVTWPLGDTPKRGDVVELGEDRYVVIERTFHLNGKISIGVEPKGTGGITNLF